MTGRFHRDPCLAHVARWIAFRGEALIPDRGMAEHFLRRLDPDAERFSFRTFSDTGYTRAGAVDPLERAIHGSLDECWSELVRLNSAGAAISVTINETDGRGRAARNILRVRALFLDDDSGGDTGRFPLPPHLQVRTSDHRCHYYWFVDGLPMEVFEACQQRLAMAYAGDPRVFALNQSMQLPGLWRRKTLTEPRLPHSVTLSQSANYRAEVMLDLLAALPDRMRQPGLGNGQGRVDSGA